MSEEEKRNKKILLGLIISRNRVEQGLSKRDLATKARVKYNYLKNIEIGSGKVLRGALFRISKNLILVQEEMSLFLSIIEQIREVNITKKVCKVQRNYSKKYKKATRKRSGVPADIRHLKNVRLKNFNR